MITIFHNARCSKSREGMCELEEAKAGFETREYMKDPLSEKELEDLIRMLGIKPKELVRTNEELYREKYAHRKIYGREWIRIMAKHPELIQRPIIVKDGKAIIGRPTEKIAEFLNS
jgi:arsenate reductase (glutaredoxin)